MTCKWKALPLDDHFPNTQQVASIPLPWSNTQRSVGVSLVSLRTVLCSTFQHMSNENSGVFVRFLVSKMSKPCQIELLVSRRNWSMLD